MKQELGNFKKDFVAALANNNTGIKFESMNKRIGKIEDKIQKNILSHENKTPYELPTFIFYQNIFMIKWT